MSLQNLPGEGNQGEPLRQEAQGAPAAPEYPIRALVRADALHYPVNGLCRGEVIAVRPNRPSDGPGLNGYFAWGALEKGDLFFVPEELIIDPTPEQITEERAKIGLPAETAPAVPEAPEGSLTPCGEALAALKVAEEFIPICEVMKVGLGAFSDPVGAKALEGFRNTVLAALAKLEGR